MFSCLDCIDPVSKREQSGLVALFPPADYNVPDGNEDDAFSDSESLQPNRVYGNGSEVFQFEIAISQYRIYFAFTMALSIKIITYLYISFISKVTL